MSRSGAETTASTPAPTGSAAQHHRSPPRLVLSEKQADTVGRLADAAVEEVREHGYAGLTVRNVARRAGVAAATAYTYFASKDHLIAEVFWRRLAALPAPVVDPDRPAEQRVAIALAEIGLLVADEPMLSAACTTAILSDEPNVRRVRDAMGADISDRLAAALGPDGSPEILRTLNLVHSGALVQAGMGNLRYVDLPARMEEAAHVILGGRS